jgi:hypothetical protein
VNANSVPVWAAGLAALGVVLLQSASQLLGVEDGEFHEVAFGNLLEHLSRTGLFSVAGGIALIGFAVMAYTLPKLMPPKIFRLGKGLPAVMGVRCTLAGAFFAAVSFLPKMLIDVRGFTELEGGLSVAVGSLGWFLGSFLQSQSWLKLLRNQIIALGGIISAIGLGLIGWFSWWSDAPFVILGLGLLAAGLGMGLAITSTSLAVMNLSSDDLYGRNTSSLQVSDSLGSAFFAGIAGSMMAGLITSLGSHHTYGLMYLVQAVVAVLSFVLALRIGRVSNESVAK